MPKPEPSQSLVQRARLRRKLRSKTSPKPEPRPDAAAHIATLLNTSLGDLLAAGLVEDPEDAGRIIAAAVGQARASITDAKPPEAEAAPTPPPEPSPQQNANLSQTANPRHRLTRSRRQSSEPHDPES